MPEISDHFVDRLDAGRELAAELKHYRGSDAIVLGLARGGIPVAYEVARSLKLALDVLVVRKLGFPGEPELAMGAVASGGTFALNADVLRAGQIKRTTLQRVAAREIAELARLELRYRDGRSSLKLMGHSAILIDDGLATGSSMLAAIRALREQDVAKVIVAVPVAPSEICEAVASHADEMLCARTPRPFVSVGSWYEDFGQTSDTEVCNLLARSRLELSQG
jgi:predicted phosphoribosyltransferase